MDYPDDLIERLVRAIAGAYGHNLDDDDWHRELAEDAAYAVLKDLNFREKTGRGVLHGNVLYMKFLDPDGKNYTRWVGGTEWKEAQ